jgi:hypothetical protein
VAITFDRDDHLDYIPNPRVYPLVVDPIITNTRLTKVLMDGGSNLNIIYAQTLDLLGITWTRLQPSVEGFHGVVPGRKLSLSKWLDSMEHIMPSLGAHATPGSWRSPITPTSSSKFRAPTVS